MKYLIVLLPFTFAFLFLLLWRGSYYFLMPLSLEDGLAKFISMSLSMITVASVGLLVYDLIQNRGKK